MSKNKAYRVIRQHDESDCGVACLATIAKYYGSEFPLQHLRELSGTESQGTTMLGLYQAGNKIGFTAEGFEARIEDLKALTQPCILHVIINNQLQHFVVLFEYKNGLFVIGDPGVGLVEYDEQRLECEWQSKTLLMLTPTDALPTAKTNRNEKLFWIKNLIHEDTTVLLLALVLGVAIAGLGLSVALFSDRLIDEILPGHDTRALGIGIALLSVLLLAKAGLGYVRRLFLIGQTRDFNNRIIGYFYDRLLRLPQSFFDNRKVGGLVARMNDTGRIQRAITYVVGNIMIDALTLIAATVALFFYSIPLGIMALCSIPVYFLITYRFSGKILSGQRATMATYAANESNYIDTIQSISTIKVSNKEEFFSGLTREVYGFFQEKVYELGKSGTQFTLWTELSGVLVVVAVVGISSMMVINGALKVGDMIAVIQIAGMLIPSLAQLSIANIQLQEARVAFDRMFEFTLLDPEYTVAVESAKQSFGEFRYIRCEHISFGFPGRAPLLHDLSCSVSVGELVVLFGESGCGKTTVLQILQKFYYPDRGAIKVNGWEWGEVSVHQLRGILGVVPQSIKMLNGSLIGNIALGENGTDAEQVVNFCCEYGFDKYFSAFPQGYMTVVGEGGVNLSGGQQQLVVLAQALYNKPRLLLLDEATSAMDRDMEAFVIRLLERLKGEMGILFVTHRIRPAINSDRIYVIENGRSVAIGTHSQLLKSANNLYSRAWVDILRYDTQELGEFVKSNGTVVLSE